LLPHQLGAAGDNTLQRRKEMCCFKLLMLLYA